VGEFERFKKLTFEDFRRLARDPGASRYEKIGFPDAYREGKEGRIFEDILSKLGNLRKERQVVLEVGPGCGSLPHLLIEHCGRQGHRLVLVDSEEMLGLLPDAPFVRKVPAYFPRDCRWLIEEYAGKVDAVLTYSVLHHVFAEGNVFDFLDASLQLLAEGGEMLIGDVPNVSKRKRFFCSPRGVRFHQEFTGSDEVPAVAFNALEAGKIDDAVIAALLLRCRLCGYDAYWLPQPDDLPMANRREDILIRRP